VKAYFVAHRAFFGAHAGYVEFVGLYFKSKRSWITWIFRKIIFDREKGSPVVIIYEKTNFGLLFSK